MSAPENSLRPRRRDIDPTEPSFDEQDPPEPYTGEPSPDYFENLLAYGRRGHVDADPTAPARQRDLPPPYMGALELPHAGETSALTRPPSADDATAAGQAGTGSPAGGAPQSQLDRDRAEYDTLVANPHPAYRHSRIRAGVENFFYNLSRNAQAVTEVSMRSGRPVDMYGIANIVGGGAGGFGAGVANPRVVAERAQQQRLDQLEQSIKFQLGVEKAHADYTSRLATAEYTRQRVPLERLKREGTQLDRDKRALLSMWRTVGEYDPADHRFDSMSKEAERLGVTLTPYKRGEKPPQRFNHLGQVWEWLEDPDTHDYYASPVLGSDGKPLPIDTSKVPDAKGLLPGQSATNEDRDRAFAAQQEQRRQMLRLSEDRFNLALTNGLSAQASREFGVKTQGLQQRLNQIRTQINGYETKAKQYLIDPADADRRIKELEGEAGGLLDQLNDAKAEALGKMSRAPALPAPAVPSGRFAGRRMKRANLPTAARELGYGEGPDAVKRAEEEIKREGGVIY